MLPCTCYRAKTEGREHCQDDGHCAAVHNIRFPDHARIPNRLAPWRRLSDERPDPKLGTVLYRLKKPGRGDRWFVGLCYFTVSGRWGIDSSGSPWPPDYGHDIQWMEIPT